MNLPSRGVLLRPEEVRSAAAARGFTELVMVKGVYDLTHLGHLESMWSARQYGDCLVVAVASDESVRARKGLGRPVLTFRERIGILSSLRMVDYLVAYEEASPYAIISKVSPVRFCASHFESLTTEEVARLNDAGIELIHVPRPPERSTSEIIRCIREARHG